MDERPSATADAPAAASIASMITPIAEKPSQTRAFLRASAMRRMVMRPDLVTLWR
jgi:hypothetical protein